MATKVSDAIGNKKLSKVTKEDFEKCYLTLAQKYSPYIIRQTMYLMNRAFQFAFENGYIKENVHNFRSISLKPKVTTILSDADMRKVYTVIRNHDEFAVYRFALTSGINFCECLALRIKDINLDEGIVHVSECTKYTALKEPTFHYEVVTIPSIHPRDVKLSSEAIEVLNIVVQNKEDEMDYVFKNEKGDPITMNSIIHLDKLIRAESNVTRFSRGIFMRTVYCKMLRQNVNAAALRDQCGVSEMRIRLYQKTKTI